MKAGATETQGELWKCRDCGKCGKPKAGFPHFPRVPWKSRQNPARFPHFHSSDHDVLFPSPKHNRGRAIALRETRSSAPQQRVVVVDRGK